MDLAAHLGLTLNVDDLAPAQRNPRRDPAWLAEGVLGHSLSRSRGRPPGGTGLKRPFETFSNEIPTEVSALPKGNLRARYPKGDSTAGSEHA